MNFQLNTNAQQDREAALQKYMATHVLNDQFVCPHFQECRESHSHEFYEGQLHHLGKFYDLETSNRPFRVVVVGQEYGGGPAQVTLGHRYGQIMRAGTGRRFKSGRGHKARNPHMRGTTSALRTVFGKSVGEDYESEFIEIDGDSVHLFDCFALVNYLLCSAVRDTSKNRTRGLSTKVMRRNCRSHFRHVMEILEPTVVIVQGKGFFQSVRSAFDEIEPVKEAALPPKTLFKAEIGSTSAFVASFTHPSAPRGTYNWGTNAKMPYLLNTVVPVLEYVRKAAL